MVVVLACGGSSAVVGGGTVNTLKILPNPVPLKPTESVQLTAVLDGGSEPITWAVNTPNGGTITQGGVYKAPASSGTYEVQVSLTSNPAKLAKANVVVDSTFTVTIEPPTETQNYAPYAGVIDLGAKVNGAPSNAVTWSSNDVSIDANGQFTAPSVPGDLTIKATSVSDPGKSASMVFHVVAPIQIQGLPNPALVIPQSYIEFSALKSGVLGTVNWSATSGTITAGGKWTADSSFNGTVDITAQATVLGQSRSQTVSVTVVPNLNVRFTFQNQGDVLFALRPDKAPNTCANLVSLASKKFYDGIFVHRYEAGLVVQWGDPLTKTLPLDNPSIGTGGPGYTIPFEANDLLNVTYSLGMARSSGLNTGGSQIYVNLGNNTGFDGSYVVFGSVFSGTGIVDALRKGDKITSATVELP